MIRTTCYFELLQEYLVEMGKPPAPRRIAAAMFQAWWSFNGLEWALRCCGIQWKVGSGCTCAARWVQETAPIYCYAALKWKQRQTLPSTLCAERDDAIGWAP